MLTYRHHRHLTRWPRRAAWACLLLLLLALGWRLYRAWRASLPVERPPATRLA